MKSSSLFGEGKKKWDRDVKLLGKCVAQNYSPEKPASILSSNLRDLKREALKFISKNWV